MKKLSILSAILVASVSHAGPAITDPQALAQMINSPGGLAGKYILETGTSNSSEHSCPANLNLKAVVTNTGLNGAPETYLDSDGADLQLGEGPFRILNGSQLSTDRQGGEEFSKNKASAATEVTNSWHDVALITFGLGSDSTKFKLKLTGHGTSERLTYTAKVQMFQNNVKMNCIYKRDAAVSAQPSDEADGRFLRVE